MKAKCIKTLEEYIQHYRNKGVTLSDKYVKGNIYKYYLQNGIYKVESCSILKSYGFEYSNFTPKLFNEYFEIL